MNVSAPTPTSTSTNDTLQTDYLVIGAGAAAMAFVDTLLSESADATVLMVDRQHRPGGHWNAAYPFVRLHQPSTFYGVASRELSSGGKDRAGINAGMDSLASGTRWRQTPTRSTSTAAPAPSSRRPCCRCSTATVLTCSSCAPASRFSAPQSSRM